MAPIFDQLGEKFADSQTIVITKIDATANELEHTKITSFPTLKLYKRGDNEVVDYNGERTLEALTKFLESGGQEGEGTPDVVSTDYIPVIMNNNIHIFVCQFQIINIFHLFAISGGS